MLYRNYVLRVVWNWGEDRVAHAKHRGAEIGLVRAGMLIFVTANKTELYNKECDVLVNKD